MEKKVQVRAIYDKDSFRFHRYQIEGNGQITGMLYISKKAEQIPETVEVQLCIAAADAKKGKAEKRASSSTRNGGSSLPRGVPRLPVAFSVYDSWLGLHPEHITQYARIPSHDRPSGLLLHAVRKRTQGGEGSGGYIYLLPGRDRGLWGQRQSRFLA